MLSPSGEKLPTGWVPIPCAENRQQHFPGSKSLSPGVPPVVRAAGGMFPFDLRRQAEAVSIRQVGAVFLVQPVQVSQGIPERDVHNRVLGPVLDLSCRADGMKPIRTGDLFPLHRLRVENIRPADLFRPGERCGRLDEPTKLAVGDREAGAPVVRRNRHGVLRKLIAPRKRIALRSADQTYSRGNLQELCVSKIHFIH